MAVMGPIPGQEGLSALESHGLGTFPLSGEKEMLKGPDQPAVLKTRLENLI